MKKKWENPQWISLEMHATASGSGSGPASEAVHTSHSLAALSS